MQTKLTISVDKEVIERAKKYARSKGSSLSELVENYLRVVVRKEEQAPALSPEIKRLKGSVKLEGSPDYKSNLKEAFAKKHQL